ncbi:hypothetical protein [Geomicrobium sp. JCM 19039]|uniref:hypothetical protein n=1 Tax=Geomicrobium sp. JCM 19039 TaxID=1460636 RepID=UPI0005A97915|nr:hypothetical protein [Geomicrobium sp. JCM 19039]
MTNIDSFKTTLLTCIAEQQNLLSITFIVGDITNEVTGHLSKLSDCDEEITIKDGSTFTIIKYSDILKAEVITL